MADGNTPVPTTIKKQRKTGPHKAKSIARQAEWYSNRLALFQKRLDETRAKIPPKVAKLMKILEDLEKT